MKAGRLTRKSHFKKMNSLPERQPAIYDMTQNVMTDGCAPLFLDELYDTIERDREEIEALPFAFTSMEDVLFWAASVTRESPTANSLLARAADREWSVVMTDLQNGGFYLDIPGKTLHLDHHSMKPSALGRSVYFRNAVLTTFIRALRDIWHEEAGRVFEEEFKPEDALLLERVRAADCDTVAILAGWELRGAGYSDVWRHLLGTEEGDMALVFTRFLERDPSAFFDGSALAYAFRQWYADDSRVDGCDHETLESLDGILLESEQHNPFGSRELTARLIEDLSVLPDGICYLAGLGSMIRRDPFFAGLQDPINQTHLFQIMYDTEVVMVNNVPFRDHTLARQIFPQGESLH